MMPIRFKNAASAVLMTFCIVSTVAVARAQAPDNSKQNKDQSALTADNQSSAKADRQMTAKIRKDLMADKDLSSYAHNIKVITVNGSVTLKGPVKSEDEKSKIAQIAANTVSANKISNEITVK